MSGGLEQPTAGPKRCQAVWVGLTVWSLFRRYVPVMSARHRPFQCRAHLGFLQLGIAKRRTNVAMTEHPLDNFDALSLRNEFAAARMSQLVRCIARRAVGIDQATDLAELRPLIVDGVVRDTRATVGAEQDVLLRRRVAERSTCRAQSAQRVVWRSGRG
jgi:hypothetical protein